MANNETMNFSKVIEMSGKPYERGFVYGSQCKNLINKFTKRWFNFISAIPRPEIALTKTEALKLTSRYFPYAKDYAPELIEECRGIADGAGISFDEIFNINCYWDILDSIHPQVRWKYLAHGSHKRWLPYMGCTAFAVSKSATKKSHVILGQNFDLGWEGEIFQETATLIKIIPDNGPSCLCFSNTGMIGALGMNSSGIALVINKLFPLDSEPGVPFFFVVRKVLQQEKIGDAIGAIIDCKRASGIHYLLCDQNGEIFSIETTAADYDVVIPLDGTLGHTNHYVSERLKPLDFHPPINPDSLVRWSRINKYLEEKKGEITIEDCQKWMKDHVNYPLSICRHDHEQGKTIASLIMLPKELEFLATYGNPCTQPYVKYLIPRRS